MSEYLNRHDYEAIGSFMSNDINKLIDELSDMNGCCLHIVIEDYNLEDSHVNFCLEEARKTNHLDCLIVASALKDMTVEERWKLTGFKDGHFATYEEYMNHQDYYAFNDQDHDPR